MGSNSLKFDFGLFESWPALKRSIFQTFDENDPQKKTKYDRFKEMDGKRTLSFILRAYSKNNVQRIAEEWVSTSILEACVDPDMEKLVDIPIHKVEFHLAVVPTPSTLSSKPFREYMQKLGNGKIENVALFGSWEHLANADKLAILAPFSNVEQPELNFVDLEYTNVD